MARRHPGLPRSVENVFSKASILENLQNVDSSSHSREKILNLENQFRNRISSHITTLPRNDSKFQKFNTSPFVLMIHCLKKGYSSIKEIEEDILPAKEFASMETSAGRMIEDVMLPAYGWNNVRSEMHTSNSALDGKKIEGDVLKLTTLKGGPRCLNDEMSENFADEIINNAEKWEYEANVNKIDFTYGVLYGTKKISNKKDWHILRNIKEKIPSNQMLIYPDNRWNCSFKINEVTVEVTVRIGRDWWDYLGGENCFMELCASLIRACVVPSDNFSNRNNFIISDLYQIVSTRDIPSDFNVSILQKSQLEWLFFLARHFCDKIL